MSAEDSAPRVAPTDVPPHISVAADGDDQMRGPGSPGPTGASLGTARSVQFHVLTKLSVRADTDAEDSSNNQLSASERRPNGKLDRRSLAGDARMNMDFLKLPDIDVALAPHEALQLAEQEHQAAQELHDEEVVQEVVIQGEDTTHALGTEADSGHHHRVRTHIKTQKVSITRRS